MDVDRYLRVHDEIVALIGRGDTGRADGLLAGVLDYPAAGLAVGDVARFAWIESLLHAKAGRTGQAEQALALCDGAVDQGADPVVAVLAYSDAVESLHDIGEESGARTLLPRALRALDRVDLPALGEDPDLEDLVHASILLHGFAGDAAVEEGRIPAGVALYERAYAGSVRLGDHGLAGLLSESIMLVSIDRDPAAALDAAERALRHARAAGVEADDAVHLVRVCSAHELGRADDVRRWGAEAEDAYRGERSAREYRVRLVRAVNGPSSELAGALAELVSELAGETDDDLRAERARAVHLLATHWSSTGRQLLAAQLLEETRGLFAGLAEPELEALRADATTWLRASIGQQDGSARLLEDLRSGDRERVFRAATEAVHHADPALTHAVLTALESLGLEPVTDVERATVALLKGYAVASGEPSGTASLVGIVAVLEEIESDPASGPMARMLAASGLAVLASAVDRSDLASLGLDRLRQAAGSQIEQAGIDFLAGTAEASRPDGGDAEDAARRRTGALERLLPPFIAVEAMRYRLGAGDARTAILRRLAGSAGIVLTLAESLGDARLRSEIVAVIAASGRHESADDVPEYSGTLDLSDPLGHVLPGASEATTPPSALLLHGGEGVALRPPPWVRMPDGSIALLSATLRAADLYGIPLDELRSPDIVDLGL